MESDLKQLLILLKGEQFQQILEEHNFNANNLKYLNKICLDDIIPRNLYGPRLEFEYHLKKWQEDEGVVTMINCHHNQGTNFLRMTLDEISIEDILRSSLSGRQILHYYGKNESLNSTHRKLLSSCVVQFLIENKVTSSPKTFESIAEKIENLFPNENKDIYYIPIKGRKPAGYLYSKYHNSLTKLRKEGVYETKFAPKGSEGDSFCEEDDVQDENQTSNKDWLRYNVEPLNIVMRKWEETFNLRNLFLREQHSLLDIFEEWPLLKQSYGYKLILADFSILFPEKINLIFEKWEGFCKPILELIQSQVKSSESLELLKKLKESQDNSELRNIIILHLLHTLIKPSSRKCVINETTRKRKFVKTSIEDSRNALLLWAPTVMELNTKIKLIIDDLYSKKQTLQPITCGIGRSLLHLTEFYVYYGNVFYKLSNLITCVDVAFKIFHVLNLKYPEDCKNIWLFFQQYFYNIDIKSVDKNTILASVLNDIKTTEL